MHTKIKPYPNKAFLPLLTFPPAAVNILFSPNRNMWRNKPQMPNLNMATRFSHQNHFHNVQISTNSYEPHVLFLFRHTGRKSWHWQSGLSDNTCGRMACDFESSSDECSLIQQFYHYWKRTLRDTGLFSLWQLQGEHTSNSHTRPTQMYFLKHLRVTSCLFLCICIIQTVDCSHLSLTAVASQL